MLVPYSALCELPSTTLDNLIKEFLLTQVEDGGFSNLESNQFEQAIKQCRLELQQGSLVVEYSENDESISIRHIEQMNGPKPYVD